MDPLIQGAIFGRYIVILSSDARSRETLAGQFQSFECHVFLGSEPKDMINHIAGGVLMGFGGVTALGCTIGQGITGISTLALGSFVTLGAIIVGCALTVYYQYWQIGRKN